MDNDIVQEPPIAGSEIDTLKSAHRLSGLSASMIGCERIDWWRYCC
jgi:hypothetical protein